MIPKTTAQFRAAAEAAESNLNWLLAAAYYEKAIDVYPNTNANSELRKADIKLLQDRAKECRQIAKGNPS